MLAWNAPIKHRTLWFGNQGDESKDSVFRFFYRNWNGDLLCLSPYHRGWSPQSIYWQSSVTLLVTEKATVLPAFSSPRWEWQSREKAHLHCSTGGSPRRRTFPKSVPIEQLQATRTRFLVYVILCKNIGNLQQVRNVSTLNYVRTSIQVYRIAGFILIAEKPTDTCSLFCLSIDDL